MINRRLFLHMLGVIATTFLAGAATALVLIILRIRAIEEGGV